MKKHVIEAREALAFFLILLVLLAAGSLWDAPISCAVYNESSRFGQILAAYGEYPAALGWVAAGVLLIVGRNREKKALAVLQILVGGLLTVFGALMTCVMPTVYLDWPKPVLFLIGLLCSCAAGVLMVRLGRHARRDAVLRTAAALFFAILAEMLLINLIKIPWGRPLMRLIASDSRAFFLPWWQPGTALRDQLTALGVAAEEFKSFPSGHAGNAVTLLLLGLLPQLNERLAPKRLRFVILGFVWTCLVSFSRIIMGAHFLSDTAVGMLTGLLCCLLVTRLVFRSKAACPPQS